MKVLAWIVVLIVVIYGADRLWRARVMADVWNSRSLPTGETVRAVMEKKLGNQMSNVVLRVSNGDFAYFEAKVFCMNVTNSILLFAWQWDIAWPSVRALTPSTAETFPLLDPGCFLTPTGHSTLWSGRQGIPLYFERRGASEGNK